MQFVQMSDHMKLLNREGSGEKCRSFDRTLQPLDSDRTRRRISPFGCRFLARMMATMTVRRF
jgi:hypothetical protein